MKLYNSLTKSFTSIKPQEGNCFRIYSCGPTVYDYVHIGNLSSFIAADTLKRTLKCAGYKVQHVMNLTDVDDKTIKRSLTENPTSEPKEALSKLTRHYEDVFKKDIDLVGIDVNEIDFIRATDMIPEMLVLISTLYDNGFAYIANDGVYFSIDSYQKSGKKYGQLINLNNSAKSKHRISNDEYDKESINDFALWKSAKNNEPKWIFSLGGKKLDGRPGWHIECSTMSSCSLGQPFDIHTGGEDLLFPHHENEIAQSTAGRDNPTYAKTFFHNKHLLVNGKKMSKSLGNFVNLQDIKEKGYSPLAFRLLTLQSHYQNQSNFTWENLQSAQNRLNRWLKLTDLKWQINTQYESISKELVKTMANNLDTPKTLLLIDDYFTKLENQKLSPNNDTLDTIIQLLGIDLRRDDINDDQKKLIKQRSIARANNDWKQSDEIRDNLKLQGIELCDDNDTTYWNRI